MQYKVLILLNPRNRQDKSTSNCWINAGSLQLKFEFGIQLINQLLSSLLGWCSGVCKMGGETFAYGGGMGMGCSRRLKKYGISLGSWIGGQRENQGKYMAGEISLSRWLHSRMAVCVLHVLERTHKGLRKRNRCTVLLEFREDIANDKIECSYNAWWNSSIQ